MSRSVTVLPSARRLMESLRDIGYDLPSAIADLVDNSIDAGARNVSIDIVADRDDSWIRIADDGIGMSSAELDEAMRYGSTCAYGERALGHFGLGLKTGSLSQCRRLTVASRRHERGRIQARRWDLDTIARSDRWELEAPARQDLRPAVVEPLQGCTGTVVLWEHLDRVLALRNPRGAVHAERAMDAVAREVGEHLAMVFHRFLSGEWADGAAKITIIVNGRPLRPWDPFAREEPRSRRLATQTIALALADGREVHLAVQPWILPSQTSFSSPEAHVAAAGPKRWNRQQGLYIYRRERLIQSGGWNRLRTLDEHAKLARIAVDLPLGHEDLFAINVAKMSVTIPDAARAPLRAIASAVVAEAQRSYREHLHQSVAPAAPPTVPDGPQEAPNAERETGPSISGDWPTILRTVQATLAAQPELRDLVLLDLANAVG